MIKNKIDPLIKEASNLEKLSTFGGVYTNSSAGFVLCKPLLEVKCHAFVLERRGFTADIGEIANKPGEDLSQLVPYIEQLLTLDEVLIRGLLHELALGWEQLSVIWFPYNLSAIDNEVQLLRTKEFQYIDFDRVQHLAVLQLLNARMILLIKQTVKNFGH